MADETKKTKATENKHPIEVMGFKRPDPNDVESRREFYSTRAAVLATKKGRLANLARQRIATVASRGDK